MPNLISLKNFYGMNTLKKKLDPRSAREMADMVAERGLIKTRPGFGKYNVVAQSGAILGIFDYRRKNGQMGFLMPDANGDIYKWEQFHFGSGWVWNPTLWNPILGEWGYWEWEGDNFWWTGEYEANELPTVADPVWTIHAGDPSISSISDGFLTITGEDAVCIYKRLNVLGDNATGNIIEARVKSAITVGDTLRYLQIADNAKAAELLIYADRISCYGDIYSMDTTDDYHIYRITLKSTSAKVYVDGVLRISKTATNANVDQILFGYSAGSWDYVRYYVGGF